MSVKDWEAESKWQTVVMTELRSRLTSLEKELEEARVQWRDCSDDRKELRARADTAEAALTQTREELKRVGERAANDRAVFAAQIKNFMDPLVRLEALKPLPPIILSPKQEELKAAQAARLEACEGESARAVERDAALAAVAELKAVLEWWVRTHDHNNTKPPVCVGLVGPPETAGEAAERLSASRKALASTSLGKGWLPPEAAKAAEGLAAAILQGVKDGSGHDLTTHDPSELLAQYEALQVRTAQLRAALALWREVSGK